MINKDQFKEWLEKTDQRIIPEARNFVSLSDLRSAAVAIILIEKDIEIPENLGKKEYSIVFGKRSNKVPTHKGQIAFPGGALDKNDKDLKETAMRETLEEIGVEIDLKSTEWQYLGQYPNSFITISDYLITPFVFVFRSKNGRSINFIPDGYEIVEVFDIPIKHLLDPKNKRMEKREWQGQLFDMHYFTYKGKTVWGITGWLLHDFLTALPLNS